MKKKNYYYKIISEKFQKYGGRAVIAEVYTVKKNEIIVLGETTWNTVAFKGEDSTVYTFLHDLKLVTNKEFKLYGGYYLYLRSKVSIKRL